MRSKGIRRLGGILGDRKAIWGQKLLSLVSLARIASKESIEILERYYKNAGPEMKRYAKLAFQEAKYLAKVA